MTEDNVWGGSGITKGVFDCIVANVPMGSVIIELGAGLVSTQVLSCVYKLTSIEHNKKFMDIYPGVNYIYAPLVNNQWYNVDILKQFLFKDHVFVLVDGPEYRQGVVENIDLFNTSASFLVHDTWREYDRKVANDLANVLCKSPVFHKTKDDDWCFIQ